MSASYLSLNAFGEGRYEEKKSEFLAFASPVTTEKEALEFIGDIKRRYPDARHHVYAYQLREDQKSRYTDDGEPSGTAGIPVLDLLRKKNLTDCVIVVVRYFGGTLLGTGGLVHAYTVSAQEAIDNAEIVLWQTVGHIRVSCSYAEYQRLLPLLQEVDVQESSFTSEVTLSLVMAEETVEGFIKKVTDKTGGSALCTIEGTSYGKTLPGK